MKSVQQAAVVGLRVLRPLHSNFLRWLEGRKGACACLVSQHYGTSTTPPLSLPAGYCSAQSSHLDIIFPREPPTTSGRARLGFTSRKLGAERERERAGGGEGGGRRGRGELRILSSYFPRPARPASPPVAASLTSTKTRVEDL